jgi:sugar transferase (PEP-CTERM/EpsH1 system associated)
LVNHFVCVSDDLRRWLVEEVRVLPSKVTTIHNGVSLARFGQAGRLESRVRLGLPAEAPIIGTVGRLDPVKDQAGLIRAFATVRATHPEVLLVIAGDGPCRSDLQQVARTLGQADRVRLLGIRDDIPAVMAALDIFALPSLGEGISNTVLEAMATGLPVIATRVGGNSELVEDGVSGVLVSCQDHGALATAMVAYVRDSELRRRHGGAGRERATRHFSLERMVQTYSDLYASLASRRLARSA